MEDRANRQELSNGCALAENSFGGDILKDAAGIFFTFHDMSHSKLMSAGYKPDLTTYSVQSGQEQYYEPSGDERVKYCTAFSFPSLQPATDPRTVSLHALKSDQVVHVHLLQLYVSSYQREWPISYVAASVHFIPGSLELAPA
jgi:hypothetical protein